MNETLLRPVPTAIERCLQMLASETENAVNFQDIKRIYNMRDERYTPLTVLAQQGHPSAIRLLEMMQAVYCQANLPQVPTKLDFDGLKQALGTIFSPEQGLCRDLTALDVAATQYGTKEAPMGSRCGISGALVKSLEVTLRQLADKEGTARPFIQAKLFKSRFLAPIIMAGMGKKAMEEYEVGDFAESASMATQAALIAATEFGLGKPAARLGQRALQHVSQEVTYFARVQKLLMIGGRATPIVGIVFSETGTLIGVVMRAQEGDITGAVGTFIVGTAGNLAAEFSGAPWLNVVAGEVVEEACAQAFNGWFKPQEKVRGAGVVQALGELFPGLEYGNGFTQVHRDAEGRFIFHAREMLTAPVGQDALRTVRPETPSISMAQLPPITADEQVYLDSVVRKLKDDPKMEAIIQTLTGIFNRTSGNDYFLEGEAIDKQLESRGVNTKSWTRY